MPTFPDSVQRIDRAFGSHLSPTDKLVAVYIAWREFSNPFDPKKILQASDDLGLTDYEIQNALSRITLALDWEASR
jgi:hypothetical protein